MSMLQVQVEGMTCQGCASSIEKALAKSGKVKVAHVDLNAKKLTVDGDISETEVVSLLDGMGFKASVVGH